MDIITKLQGIRVGKDKITNYLNSKIEKIDILEAKEEFLNKFTIEDLECEEKGHDLENFIKIKRIIRFKFNN